MSWATRKEGRGRREEGRGRERRDEGREEDVCVDVCGGGVESEGGK